MIAQDLAKALGGRWFGSYGAARCPAHDDRKPSLSVGDHDGRLLVHCFAGCSQAEVIAALQSRGLWSRGSDEPHGVRRAEHRRLRKDNAAPAITIWRSARSPENTTVSRYLLGRGITGPIPKSIRFHPQLLHRQSDTRIPALVAAVHGPRGDIVGVHRTYLKSDGGGKADVTPQKMALGHIKGGAVRLGSECETLVLAEGIEDALAIMQMTRQTTWAVLGTAGFLNFVPPASVRRIILAPDGDTAGRSVIGPAGDRLLKMGFQVEVALAPSGSDWNDVLLEFDERAAIREFCNGECRDSAEEMALQETMRSPDG